MAAKAGSLLGSRSGLHTCGQFPHNDGVVDGARDGEPHVRAHGQAVDILRVPPAASGQAEAEHFLLFWKKHHFLQNAKLAFSFKPPPKKTKKRIFI